MASFQRAQVDIIRERLEEPPRHLIAVFGPRQTGKTTIVRQALGRIHTPHLYVSADDPAASQVRPESPEIALAPQVLPQLDSDWLVRQWEDARVEAGRSPKGFVLAIDEIQKIPMWSEIVKGLWDADRDRNTPLHVIILGSAPLLFQSGLTESLAGRFESVPVSHWSFDEMASAFDFDLETYIYFGGYPGAATFLPDQPRWREYVLTAIIEPNIERDIVSMARVDKPALMKLLFTLGSTYSGQILSYTKMVGQLHDAGNTTTLARYLELLGSAGMLAGLQNWFNQPYRRRASSPKLNVLNTALMTAGSGYSFEEAKADRTFWGRIVESAVGAHLLNTASSDTKVHYWRHRSFEVDYVLQRGARTIAVEVGSGRTPHSERGLAEFGRRFDPVRSFQVGVGGVPVADFLTTRAEDWFESS